MQGIELVILRLTHDMRQYELAQLLSVPPTVVCDWEKGRRPITPEIKARIRKAIQQTQGVKGNG